MLNKKVKLGRKEVNNMRERRKRRAKRVALVRKLMTFSFLYLIFFTVHFSMITFSKYTGISAGNGNTSVAKWEVSADNNISSKNISLIAGSDPQEYKIRVTGKSEVSSKYSIVISNVPNNVKISLDGGTQKLPEDNEISFSNAGQFEANDTNFTHEHTLNFYALVEADQVQNRQLSLNIIFTQDEL